MRLRMSGFSTRGSATVSSWPLSLSFVFARVAGRTWSLDQIEHDVIRARFGDPRVHFALVCAALGCPPLRAEAYRGETLDPQLDDQARVFLLRSPDRNGVDVAKGWIDAQRRGGKPERIAMEEAALCGFAERAAREGAKVVFEATGGYDRPLAAAA